MQTYTNNTFGLSSFLELILSLVPVLMLISILLLVYLFYKYKTNTVIAAKAYFLRRIMYVTIFSVTIAIIFSYLFVYANGSATGIQQGGSVSIPQNSAYVYSNSVGESISSIGSVFLSKDNESSMVNYSNAASYSGVTIDNREFNKITYGALLKTRDIEKDHNLVTSFIKAADGRIDSDNATQYYVGINFVVPKDNFESFKANIKSIVKSDFYIDSISINNRVLEKKSIEALQENNIENINFNNDRIDAENSRHTKAVNKLNSDLKLAKGYLADISSELIYATDTARINTLRDRESELLNNKKIIESNIQIENSNYSDTINAYKISLQSDQNEQNALNKKDGLFLEDISTVEGRIVLKHISIWKYIETSLSISLPVVIITLLLGIYLFITYKLIRKSNDNIKLLTNKDEALLAQEKLSFSKVLYVLVFICLAIFSYFYIANGTTDYMDTYVEMPNVYGYNPYYRY